MSRKRTKLPGLHRTVTTSLLVLLCGCAALRSTTTPPPAFFSLDRSVGATVLTASQGPAAGVTLVVNLPGAAAGFDSQRIIYVRRAHELEYFAHSEWIDTPARMLGPLIVAALEQVGAFGAVIAAPSSVAGELRLDTEIIRLQHEFLQRPSGVHFTLRATLMDFQTRRVLAAREFDTFVAAPSEDPYGGVLAADQAVNVVLAELATFCVSVAGESRKNPFVQMAVPGQQ